MVLSSIEGASQRAEKGFIDAYARKALRLLQLLLVVFIGTRAGELTRDDEKKAKTRRGPPTALKCRGNLPE